MYGSIAGMASSALGQWWANDFASNQAGRAMRFADQERIAQDNWMTQMSNTAMQRRVVDLKQAGLNPLLAVSQGGASSPMGGAPMGAVGNPVSGVNVAASGAQLANVAAQTRKTNADAAYTEAVTPDNPDVSRNNATYKSSAEVDKLFSDARVNNMTIKDLQSQIDYRNGPQVHYLLNQIDLLDAQIPGAQANSDIAGLDLKFKRQLFNYLVDAAQKEQKAAGSSAQAQADFNASPLGRIFRAVFGVGPDVSNAVSSGSSLIRALKPND